MTPTPFIFATGIENSYPTIRLPDGRQKRVDEMAKSDHYARWEEDFARVRELGIQFLRYGPPYYKTHLGPGHYDWSFADETFNALREMDITPIADLCHFGVPDWLQNFQNPDFVPYFREYAHAFASRYPWLRLYTPVNEMLVTARFSAKFGWWNERLTSDTAFVTALKNIVKANVGAMSAILSVQPDARFIQSESSEYFHAVDPSCLMLSDQFNEQRFLSLDLNYGYNLSAKMYQYLTDHGMTRDEYAFFQHNTFKRFCVMGTDYYVTNEHLVSPDGGLSCAGEIFGYYVITKQYYDRYKLPVMHTETNICEEANAVAWLKKEWANMVRLREDGVPVIGFTWYSLTDQVDWDTALREDNGRVNTLGLYDLDRNIRPAGSAYRSLIEQWRDIIPTESVCLSFY